MTEADDFTRTKLRIHEPYLPAFDYVFTHTRRSLPMLQSVGVTQMEELIWPHFPAIYAPVASIPQDLDVLFVGTLSPYRKTLLARIASRHTVSLGKNVFHGQSGAMYARAKIVLNIHCTPLRNFECRVVEVLGCGGFLLTEALEPDDVFQDRKHLVVFHEKNVVAMIEHYLRNEEQRRGIAHAGSEAVQKFHVANQVKRILEVAMRLTGNRLGDENPSFTVESVVRGFDSHQLEKQDIIPNPAPNPGVKMSQVRQITVTINNRSIPLSYPASAGNDCIVKGVFSDNEYPFLPYLRAQAKVIVDIGANIGCASIWFTVLYPDATIYAFEPASDTFGFLRSNTLPLPNIRAFNFGMFDRECTAKLYQGQEVTLRRLSTVIAEQRIDRISILKIDTEGAELPILRDIKPFLDRVDAIFLEYYSEKDRLELDRLLSERYILVHGKVHTAHRGVLNYVAKDLIRAHTNLNELEIVLPGFEPQ